MGFSFLLEDRGAVIFTFFVEFLKKKKKEQIQRILMTKYIEN